MSDISDGLVDEAGSVSEPESTENRQLRSDAPVCTDRDILIIKNILDRADASESPSSFLSVIQAYNAVLSSLNIESANDYVYFPILLALSRIQQDTWNHRLDYFLNHASDMGFASETDAEQHRLNLLALGADRYASSLKKKYLRRWMIATLNLIRRSSRLESIAEFNDSNTLLKEAWSAWRTNFIERAKDEISANGIFNTTLMNKYTKLWRIKTRRVVKNLTPEALVFLNRTSFKRLISKMRSAAELREIASKASNRFLLRRTFSQLIARYSDVRCNSLRRNTLRLNTWRQWERSYKLQLVSVEKAVRFQNCSLKERYFQIFVHKMVLCTEKYPSVANDAYSKTLARDMLRAWTISCELRARERALRFSRDFKIQEKAFNILMHEGKLLHTATFFYLNHLGKRYLTLWRLAFRLEAEHFNYEKEALHHSLRQWQTKARLSAIISIRHFALLSTSFRQWRDQAANLRDVLSYASRSVEALRSKHMLANTLAEWHRKIELFRRYQIQAFQFRSYSLRCRTVYAIVQKFANYKSLQQTATNAFAVKLKSGYMMKWRGAEKFYVFLLDAAENYANQRHKEEALGALHIWRCKVRTSKFDKIQGKRLLDKWRHKLQIVKDKNVKATRHSKNLANTFNRNLVAHFLTLWRRKYMDLVFQYATGKANADISLVNRYLSLWVSRENNITELHRRYSLFASNEKKQLLQHYFTRFIAFLEHQKTCESVAASYSDDVLLENAFKTWLERTETLAKQSAAANLVFRRALLRLGWSRFKASQRTTENWTTLAYDLQKATLRRCYFDLLKCRLRDKRMSRNVKALEAVRVENSERICFLRYRQAFVFWSQMRKSAEEHQSHQLKGRAFHVWLRRLSLCKDATTLATEWRKSYLIQSHSQYLWGTFRRCKDMSELASEVLEARQYGIMEQTIRSWKLAMFNHYDRQYVALEFLENRFKAKMKQTLSDWCLQAQLRRHHRGKIRRSYLLTTLEALNRRRNRTVLEQVISVWRERIDQIKGANEESEKISEKNVKATMRITVKHWRLKVFKVNTLRLHAEEVYGRYLMKSTFTLLMDKLDNGVSLKHAGEGIWDRKMVWKADEIFGLWRNKTSTLCLLQNWADRAVAKHRKRIMVDSLRLWRVEVANIRLHEVVNEAQCELALNQWKYRFDQIQVMSSRAAEFSKAKRSRLASCFASWRRRGLVIGQNNSLAEKTCHRFLLKHVFRLIYKQHILKRRYKAFLKDMQIKSAYSLFILWRDKLENVKGLYKEASYFDKSCVVRNSLTMFKNNLQRIDKLEELLETKTALKGELYIATCFLLWRDRNIHIYKRIKIADHCYNRHLENVMFYKWKAGFIKLKSLKKVADNAHLTSICLDVINVWQSKLELMKTLDGRAKKYSQDYNRMVALKMWVGSYRNIEYMNLMQKQTVDKMKDNLLVRMFELWHKKQQNLVHNRDLASRFYSTFRFMNSLNAWRHRYFRVRYSQRLCAKVLMDKESNSAKNIIILWMRRESNIQNNEIRAQDLLMRNQRKHCIKIFHCWRLEAVSLQLDRLANNDMFSRYLTHWRQINQDLERMNAQATIRFNASMKRLALQAMMESHRSIIWTSAQASEKYNNNLVKKAVVYVSRMTRWCEQIKIHKQKSSKNVKKRCLENWHRTLATHRTLDNLATAHYGRILMKTALNQIQMAMSLTRMKSVQSIEVAETKDLQRLQRMFTGWLGDVRILLERKSLSVEINDTHLKKRYFLNHLCRRWKEQMMHDKVSRDLHNEKMKRTFFKLIKIIFDKHQYNWNELSLRHKKQHILRERLNAWREETECRTMLKRSTQTVSNGPGSKVAALGLIQWRMALSKNDERAQEADTRYAQVMLNKYFMRWRTKTHEIFSLEATADELLDAQSKKQVLSKWYMVASDLKNRLHEMETLKAQITAKTIFRKLKIKVFLLRCNNRKADEFYGVWGSGNLERRVWIHWRTKKWQLQLDKNTFNLQTPHQRPGSTSQVRRYPRSAAAAAATVELPAHLASPSYRWRKIRNMMMMNMSEPATTGGISNNRYEPYQETPTARRRLEFSSSE